MDKDHLFRAFAWANFHGPQGIGTPFESIIRGIFKTLIGIEARW